MPERLSSQDVAVLYLEGRTTPMHLGSLAAFEPQGSGLDYERLVALIEERISLVPRYRQKVRAVPSHLANPVWVDDPGFDITFHVRRSALPKPGSRTQLQDFCARVLARPLDRHRPLWEMYLIEGLADGRVAVLTKTHHALVDGIGSVDLGQVILDASPQPRDLTEALWMPAPEPSGTNLVLGAVVDLLRRPAALRDVVTLGAWDAHSMCERFTAAATGMATSVAAVVRPAPATPLTAHLGEQRRLALVRTELAHYRAVRSAHGATVNDVVLGTVAGALRGWMLSRGASVKPTTAVRALVPVSVRTGADDGAETRVAGLYVDLPIGESSPILRLSQIAYQTASHRESVRSVSADRLAALGGLAPPTLHAMAARLASGIRGRTFQLVVQNVPGPQQALYAAGARLVETFPMVALSEGHALSIGVTSYDGSVFYGLSADRDAIDDLDVLAAMVEESLSDLLALSHSDRAERADLAPS